MKILLFPKPTRILSNTGNIPRLHILIGHYCYDSCDNHDCKLKNSKYPKLLDKLSTWLYKHNIACIHTLTGKYSGTKYCPCKLPTIKDCDNCKWAAGYDNDCNGLCSSKDYHHMTSEERFEDYDNGLLHRCRFWEPGEYYKEFRKPDEF